LNAVPKFMGKIVTEPKMLPVALAIPLIIFLIVLGLTGHLRIPEGKIVYAEFFPVPYIDAIFMTAAGLAVLSFVVSIRRFWKSLNKEPYKLMASGNIFVALYETVVEFLKHRRFEKCEVNSDRKIAHLLVFYGFVGLFITTNWAVFYLYGLKWESPYPLSDPLKWFGNISALSLLIGALMVVMNRMKESGVNTKNSAFDWTFAIIVLLVGVTGILTELVRLADIPEVAYPMYLVHLMFVFYIIAYFPYSKLAHMVYRTIAIAYAKAAKRDVEI